jgi:hypothetical protein
MGLTIHYNLTAEAKKPVEVRRLLEALRSKALTLPFAEVSEMAHFVGPDTEYRRTGAESWRWLLIQAQAHVPDPEREGYSYSVLPLEVYGFRTWPGQGCEEATFGLCLYPETVQRPDGSRFLSNSS